MRMYDIILKKREGNALTGEEIRWFIERYTNGGVPDYQASALLMAICLNGMEEKETAELTMAMAESGGQMDLSAIEGVKADKHSTGGVGDKTTLAVVPIVASLGVKMAKMSGRGLGHTGGTIDKLCAIPGFQVSLERERFFSIVKETGCCVIGQTGNLCPADKKLYALRDVTATVESIPLIASSIMSKKLAAGADCILLDVKAGSGAFMKTGKDALDLARAMVSIGEHAGRKTAALITNMDSPLGRNIGNALEVEEAVLTLKGEGPEDLTEVCLRLSAEILSMAGKGTPEECHLLAKGQIANGQALLKLQQMVKAQGGDDHALTDFSLLPRSARCFPVYAPKGGYLAKIDTRQCGAAAMELGAGRREKDDTIDYGAGICLKKQVGDRVREGELIATFHTEAESLFKEAEKVFAGALVISDQKRPPLPLFYARVTKNGAEPASGALQGL